ncbi:MMPL family transporter [Amycolatopsis sp. ATCC 39116]|uniref:MMPL family transporter n=1 Tax=Amycolatopsis sp. (strain ATCC 39116 / 75iv2) TaxID=385957 RepID=UPI0002625DA2|nr:MMPL family transporter [Amycolatopsis sp. ATCC 39116]
MPSPLSRLGRFTVRRRRWVLAAAVLLTLLAGALAAGAMNALTLSRIDAPGSESDQAKEILRAQFDTGPPNLLFLVTAAEGTVDDAAVRAAGEAVAADLAAQPGVAEVASYWSRGGSPALRSEDGRQAIILALVPGGVNESRERVGELAAAFTGPRGPVTLEAGGQDEVFREVGAQARTDFLRAEAIAIPLVLLLLMLVYRRVAVALVTLGVGLFAIVTTLAGLRALTAVTEVSTFAANLTLVMGLALGVDYCLFVVARYREELAAGRDVGDAVTTAVATAGRTVLFSGLTVAVSMCALLLFPLAFLRAFAYAGVLVVLTAMLGALVVLPAALAALGHRAAGPARARRSAAWYRITSQVLRRPVLTGGLALLVVLALSAPLLGARFGVPDDRVLPADSPSRVTSDSVRAGFDQEETDALYVVLPRAGEITGYAEALSELDGVAQVDSAAGTFASGTLARTPGPDAARFTADGGTFLTVIPSAQALSGDIGDLVQRVRDLPGPAAKLVGGSPAEMTDWRDRATSRVPLVLAVIVLLTLLILFLMTGSVLLPLKATVLNLLSLGVMFGALVWVFQDGNLTGLLAFTPTGTLETSIPILMFCVAYGLSMDYEVFVTSRIREEYLRTGDTNASVAAGVQRSAPLVTTAAAILALSFATYTTGGVVYLKMLGLGMFVTVLVDATLLRGVLLPAFMRLAGRANWWAPAFYRRRLARAEPQPAAGATAAGRGGA